MKRIRDVLPGVLVLATLLAAVAMLRAQDASKRPAFAIASIKPSESLDAGGTARFGRLTRVVNLSIIVLIARAYGAEDVLGGPGWVRETRYNIDARADGDPTPAETQLMLQTLLADRFKLAVHPETRQQRGYHLVIAHPGKLGPKLHYRSRGCVGFVQPVPDSEMVRASVSATPFPCESPINPGTIKGGGLTMAELAGALWTPAGGKVEDRTGLVGQFDIDLVFQPLDDAAGPDGPPPVFTAVQDQLGLKLEPAQVSVPVVVIDSVQRPTPN